ncbi:MAG: hypothetical protein IKD89_01790 [Clostridia bacterium]|nr:hypothetical protein [Clostridia bacterium]
MAARNETARAVREAVCIDTKRIYDSCRDRDCLRDIPVYFPRCTMPVINKAISVRSKDIELIWVDIDAEPISFNRGYYSVTIRYYFRITLEVFTGMGQSVNVTGVAMADKTVILFGSEGSARTFSSKITAGDSDSALRQTNNLPEASVETVDPMILQARIAEPESAGDNCCSCCCCCNFDAESLPRCVSGVFEDEITAEADKQILVTVGIFSIIRLSRKVQLLIPVYDFCIPQRDCEGASAGTDQDPCELFSQFNFPIDDFFPPNKSAFEDNCCCD